MMLNGYPSDFVFFSRKFFCGDDYDNYDNLALKLHQRKRCNPDEGWLFNDRFKVESAPRMSLALEASKKSIKIHHEYDARPLIKSYNCY